MDIADATLVDHAGVPGCVSIHVRHDINGELLKGLVGKAFWCVLSEAHHLCAAHDLTITDHASVAAIIPGGAEWGDDWLCRNSEN